MDAKRFYQHVTELDLYERLGWDWEMPLDPSEA